MTIQLCQESLEQIEHMFHNQNIFEQIFVGGTPMVQQEAINLVDYSTLLNQTKPNFPKNLRFLFAAFFMSFRRFSCLISIRRNTSSSVGGF